MYSCILFLVHLLRVYTVICLAALFGSVGGGGPDPASTFSSILTFFILLVSGLILLSSLLPYTEIEKLE